ncbi:MAG: delta-60 repeat domain-containing protein [Chthoniobacterales bacterium]
MFTQFGIQQVRAWIARRNGILTNRSRAKAPLILALVLALFGGAGLAQAADGDLDPTFGNGGKVLTDFNSSNDWLSRIAAQPDGKIVAIGDTHPSHRGALARYNPDGTLDQTFGNGGKVITVASVRESAAGLLILPDGKIMIGGSFGEFDTSFLLLRFNSNGSVDSTFGNGGMVTTNLGTDNDRVYALALQSDGKIVAAGKKGIQFNPTEQRKGNAALARYNPDGSLDPTFGSGGIVINDFGQGLESYAIEVVIQPDGRIVIAGESAYAFLVARYNSNGTLDPTFGNGGFTEVNFGNLSWDHGRDVLLQADGKIIVVGISEINSPYDSFAVARFNPDGSLDQSFGNGGKFVMVDQGDLEAGVLQSDGKLIALGTSGDDFELLRLNLDGSLDSTFGIGGIVTTTFGGSAADPSDLILQADGKLVAGGLSSTDNYFQNTDFALARYLDGANPTPTPAPTPKKGRR